jgi:transcriptional regulator with XRE-family HTH domain
MGKTVNSRIKLLRTHMGLTQQDFSSLVGLTSTHLSRIESGLGEPQSGTLQQVINKTGVDQDWLLHGKGELKTHAVQEKIASANPWESITYKELKENNSYLQKKLDEVTVMLNTVLGKSWALRNNAGVRMRKAA